MRKRILIAVLVLVMILASASTLCACDNTPNEQSEDTFTGTLSVEGYATASDAAKSYLTEEFAGETATLLFKSYEKKQDLSQKEIAELPLGEYTANDVEKAEKGEIKYSESSKEKAADDNEMEVQFKIVVLVYINGKYHYCTLISLPGEKISKSYFNYVLDLSQHDSYVLKINNTISIPDNNYLNYTDNSKLVYTKSAVYYESVKIGLADTFGIPDATAAAYALPQNDDSSWLFVRSSLNNNANVEWVQESLPVSMKEYSSNLFMTMDQTYFIKTNDGFKLDENKFGQYLEEVYGEIYNALAMSFEVQVNSVSAVFHVKDGLWRSYEGSVDLTLKSGSATIRFITSENAQISEINEATITVPQEILDLAKQ